MNSENKSFGERSVVTVNSVAMGFYAFSFASEARQTDHAGTLQKKEAVG